MLKMNTRALPVKIVDIKRIAVIGAGFFGIMTALKLAERGYSVTIFEKNRDIILGASYINQNRMHMGYHYPRSEDTAKSSYIFQQAFCNMFKEAVVNDFDHYYCIAKHGSLINGKQYIDFCDKIGLSYNKEFPKSLTLSKDQVELCIKVPEKLYDGNLLRRLLKQLLNKEDRVELSLSTEITNIIKMKEGFEIHSSRNDKITKKRFDAIINSTYSNINSIIKMVGFQTKNYQYELCEVPIVKVPWKDRTGCAIMDGPFFGILPFGFSEEYMLYDVELSVLETYIGEIPKFKLDVAHYDQEEARLERFKRYIEKAKKYIKEMENCKYLYSIYVTRIILPEREGDDARPTEILCHGNGFWSIFSGKISAALPSSEKIVEEMDRYFINFKKIV